IAVRRKNSEPFSPPENLPFGEHVARVVSGELDRVLGPRANDAIRQSSTRRAHAPELFVNALAAEQHLPSAQLAAERQTVNQPPQRGAERAEESRGAAQVVECFLAAEVEFPRLEKALWDARFQRGWNVRRRGRGIFRLGFVGGWIAGKLQTKQALAGQNHARFAVCRARNAWRRGQKWRQLQLHDHVRRKRMELAGGRAAPGDRRDQRVELLRRDQLVDLHVTREPMRVAQTLRMRQLRREHLFVLAKTDNTPLAWLGQKCAETGRRRLGRAWRNFRSFFNRRGKHPGPRWSSRRIKIGDVEDFAIRPGNKPTQTSNAAADLFVKLVVLAAQNLALHQTRLQCAMRRERRQLRQHFRQRLRLGGLIVERTWIEIATLNHDHAHTLEPTVAKHERRANVSLNADEKHRRTSLHCGFVKAGDAAGFKKVDSFRRLMCHIFSPLFCEVNVVAMRAQQKIADRFPWSFAARPRTEKLDGVAVWLRPAAVSLQHFVKPPAEIFFLFGFGSQPSIERSCGARGPLLCFVPTLFPLVESDTVDRVDVRSASDLVMTEDARFERDGHRAAFAGTGFDGEALQQAMQLLRELGRNKRVGRRRINPKRRA